MIKWHAAICCSQNQGLGFPDEPRVPCPPAVRSVIWRQRYMELQEWQAVHEDLPKASGGVRAKILVDWLGRTKQQYNKGKLSRLAERCRIHSCKSVATVISGSMVLRGYL